LLGVLQKREFVTEKKVAEVDYGKALGKIVNVEPSGQKAYINLGTRHRVTPRLSFVVFGKNDDRGANAQPKAAVEITTVYGEDLSEGKVVKVRHERAEPLEDGDELFNPSWNPDKKDRQHVVLAGIIDIDNQGIEDTRELQRRLRDFLAHLERQGMIVDA